MYMSSPKMCLFCSAPNSRQVRPPMFRLAAATTQQATYTTCWGSRLRPVPHVVYDGLWLPMFLAATPHNPPGGAGAETRPDGLQEPRDEQVGFTAVRSAAAAVLAAGVGSVDGGVLTPMVCSLVGGAAETRGDFLQVCFARGRSRKYGRKVFGSKGLRFCAGFGFSVKKRAAAGVDWV